MAYSCQSAEGKSEFDTVFLGKEELEGWSQMINVKIKVPPEFMFYKYEITQFISQMI